MMTNVDRIASVLGQMGQIARHMPPSWDGARDTVLASSPDGRYFGKILPGRGLYLAHDLKALGIRRPIAHVYERSPLMRAVEAADRFSLMRSLGHYFDAERFAVRFLDALNVFSARLVPALAIDSYDAIINNRGPNGKADDITITKSSFTTVANAWASCWQAGGLPTAGAYTAIPAGAAPTRATAGALSQGLTNPTAPDKKYLLTLGLIAAQQINMFILADLLVGAGAIDANLNTLQTINSTALTRYTSGVGVLMTFDVVTGLGATPSNLTVTYTDQDGNGSASTGAIAMTASAIAQRLQPAGLGPYNQLAVGDYGVRSVQSCQLSAAMGAGVLALNLYKPLSMMPGISANAYIERDSTTQIDGLTELVTAAGAVLGALNLYVLPNTTSTGVITGFKRTVAG